MKKQYDRYTAGSWMVLSFCIATTALLGDKLCAAVSENTEPAAWATPLKYGAVVSNSNGGTVYVSFGARDPNTPPNAIGVDVVSGGDPSITPFAGDYFTAGISNIAFKLCAQTSTNVSISAVLGGGYSGITWIRKLTSPDAVGVWQTKTAYVGSNAGWDSGMEFDAQQAAEIWAKDIKNVKFAGVRIEPVGLDAVAVTIDSLILVGKDFASSPAYLVNLGDALEARFAGKRRYADLTAAQLAIDSDHDGMSDANEILTGTNPDDPNSVFAAETVVSKANGVTIRWPSVQSCVYTVTRTSDLVEGKFTAVANGYRLIATSTGYMEFTDTTVTQDGGPYFYRIVKE